MSPHIAPNAVLLLALLVVVSVVFMFAGPALLRNLSSGVARSCGVTALHLLHLDNAESPNRADRRRMRIGKRLWFVHDEAGAVTLAQAKLNVHDDIDFAVIDEFRKSSYILDNITFHDAVSAGGQGATLTYGYNRVTTEATAGFRAIGAEYVAGEAAKERKTVDLKPLGGSFEIDRVLAAVARGGEVVFQMQQKIKAARATFHDAAINGDIATDANGFDGLDVALVGTSTEFGAADEPFIDLSTSQLTTDNADEFIDRLDEAIEAMDEAPTFIGGNGKLIAKIKSIAKRKGYYSRDRNEFGLSVERYGDAVLVNLRDKAGSTDPVVPIETRDPDGDLTDTTGLTDLYLVRLGLDGFHGVSLAGQPLVRTWLPDFSTAGASKKGEVEIVTAVALKKSKAAAVLRNIKVQ